jgi:hypothetical protein
MIFLKYKKKNIFESIPVLMLGERGRELDIAGSSVHLKQAQKRIISFRKREKKVANTQKLTKKVYKDTLS